MRITGNVIERRVRVLARAPISDAEAMARATTEVLACGDGHSWQHSHIERHSNCEVVVVFLHFDSWADRREIGA